MAIFGGRPRPARQDAAPAAEAGGQPGLPAFLAEAQSGEVLSPRRRMGLIVRLSIPSILAQVSSILMQYIDAAMVGSLGASASAAIGLVASSSWLLGGLCTAAATGFSVQVAHMIGAGRDGEARNVLRQALVSALCMGVLLAAIGASLSFPLPVWLGGEADVIGGARSYFLIYACGLPFTQLRQTCGSMLQCSGDMRTPSLLNALMCLWDVVFNSLLIFPTRTVTVLGFSFTMWGAGMEVAGAALGTALAEVVTALCMVGAVCLRSPRLRLGLGGSWRMEKKCLTTALRVAVPIAFENSILCLAQVVTTTIVAPLGTVAVAANSLAVTAESLCYMPGFGVATAATTLVGQSLGAGRRDLARDFARSSVLLGVLVMSGAALAMFLLAPAVFAMLTPVEEVRRLGTEVLRIEAFAEPLYAASIVTAGALRGAGDTLAPSLMNFCSMWGVRVPLSLLLVGPLGLHGVWLAMCIELCARGVLFLIRLGRGKWLRRSLLN